MPVGNFEKSDIVVISSDYTPRMGVMRDEVYYVTSVEGSYLFLKTVCSPDLSRIGNSVELESSNLRKATRNEQVLALQNVATRWRDKAGKAIEKYEAIMKNVEVIKRFRAGANPSSEVFGKLIAKAKAKGVDPSEAISSYMMMTANFKDLSSAAFREAMSSGLQTERSYPPPLTYATPTYGITRDEDGSRNYIEDELENRESDERDEDDDADFDREEERRERGDVPTAPSPATPGAFESSSSLQRFYGDTWSRMTVARPPETTRPPDVE